MFFHRNKIFLLLSVFRLVLRIHRGYPPSSATPGGVALMGHLPLLYIIKPFTFPLLYTTKPITGFVPSTRITYLYNATG
jgi:hypothetical protein